MFESGRRWFTRWFYQNFFYLIFLATSVSQWGVIAWIAWQLGVRSAPLLGAALALIYVFNRFVARGTLRIAHDPEPRSWLIRGYYASAFGSLLCFAYLFAVGALWLATSSVASALGLDAMSATVDRGFTLLANVGLALVILGLIYGYTVGQSRVKTRHIELKLADLPPALAGMRLVQISDIHIGSNLDPAQLQQFVRRVNELDADLVCITGDIIDSPVAEIARDLPVLAQLRAKHGVVAILGNHDHFAGADDVERALREHTEFRVLRDHAYTLEIGDAAVHIIGLDDRGRDWARGVRETPVLEDLLGGLPAAGVRLLLCHRPDIFHQAATLDIHLTLSGHTHGGQLALPWFRGRTLNPSWVMTSFDRGLFERDGSYLYVNCGLGVVGQRIRLGTPREISVFELRPAER